MEKCILQLDFSQLLKRGNKGVHLPFILDVKHMLIRGRSRNGDEVFDRGMGNLGFNLVEVVMEKEVEVCGMIPYKQNVGDVSSGCVF